MPLSTIRGAIVALLNANLEFTEKHAMTPSKNLTEPLSPVRSTTMAN
jgi:hypothetical protein